MRRDTQEIRERIISAAMKIFALHGFFKAPTGLIAREAGVSKGLLFWYFRSKDELILEVAKRSLPIDILEECLKTEEKGLELLRCVGNRYLEKYRDQTMRNLMLHTVAASHLYPTIDRSLQELCNKYLRSLARKVYGEDSKEARIKMRMFFGSLLCYTLRSPSGISTNEYLENIIKVLTREV